MEYIFFFCPQTNNIFIIAKETFVKTWILLKVLHLTCILDLQE